MREAATQIVRSLQKAGHIAYFAGGCVRDQLLGQEPKDYDVATSAQPDQVRAVFPDAMGVGAHFGVLLVKVKGQFCEVASFRTDGSYLDGRKPESVTFSSPEEDAQRRDFTINGIFFDPVAEEVIDLVGGQEDLRAGVLRAIGDPAKRFAEDHLRLLRAVRFATTLGFQIEEGTWRAMLEAAPTIRRISPERIRDELNRIWAHPRRVTGLDLLVDSGLMEQIYPEVNKLKGCEQPPKWHPEGDVYIHTRIMLGMIPPDASLSLVLSVLLHDIGKPPTFSYDPVEDRIRFNTHDLVGARMSEEMLKRLRYPNEVIEAVVPAVANHMIFKDVRKMRTAKLKRFMARPHFDDELELHRVDCASSHGKLDNWEFLRAKLEEFANAPLIPKPLLNGWDLIKLGYSPGPPMGEMLEAVQTKQLEGELKSKEAAQAWVQAEFPLPTEASD